MQKTYSILLFFTVILFSIGIWKLNKILLVENTERYFETVLKTGNMSSKLQKLLHKTTFSKNNRQVASSKQEVTSVYFCHVAKTGGTTVENMMANFAIQKNLSVALFTGKIYAHPWPSGDIEKRLLNRLPPGQKYDILYKHTVYNKTALQNIMPSSTVFVTLLRHPFSHLKSAFNFFGLSKMLQLKKNENYVEEFVANPSKWDRVFRINGGYVSMTKNFMSSFLGLNTTLNKTECRSYDLDLGDCLVKTVEDAFDLVMITEMFDESLLLLRRLLKWSYGRILYLPLRKLPYRTKYKRTNQELLENHKSWSSIDYKLYDHFSTKLKNLVRTLGQEFANELQFYKDMLRGFRTFCYEVLRQLWLYKKGLIQMPDLLKTVNKVFSTEDSFTQSSPITGSQCIILSLSPEIMDLSFKAKYSCVGGCHSVLEIGINCTKAESNYRHWIKDNIFCNGTMLAPNVPLEIFHPLSNYSWPILVNNFKVS